MDYYTPLASREQSYKEFMQEWICDQFMHSIEDYGLQKPWYWDEFMDCLDHSHHSGHLGTWFYRWTLFWNPDAWRRQGRARVAQLQVPGLGGALRATVGPGHLQRQ